MWYIIVHIPFGELIFVRHYNYIRYNKEPIFYLKIFAFFLNEIRSVALQVLSGKLELSFTQIICRVSGIVDKFDN